VGATSAALGDEPVLTMLIVYIAAGGVFFVLQPASVTWRQRRRRAESAAASLHSSRPSSGISRLGRGARGRPLPAGSRDRPVVDDPQRLEAARVAARREQVLSAAPAVRVLTVVVALSILRDGA